MSAAPAGREVPIVWRGRRARAFVPDQFAGAIRSASTAQSGLIAEVEALKRQWRQRLGNRVGRAVRRDAAAWRTLDVLPRHLVLTSQVVAKELGVTLKAGKAALDQLADLNVVVRYDSTGRHGRGRPAAMYVSSELLGLLGSTSLR
ncbi:MAG: hypothetical protein ACRDWW_05450 [Acidimicrobiales bacterium]